MEQIDRLPEQESSSTRSTGSRQDAVNMGVSEQCVSVQYGHDCEVNKTDIDEKSVPTLGNHGIMYSAQNIDYGQSIPCIPFPYADSYLGGMMAAYGPHAIIHPQLVGVAQSARVPLPIELTENEPIYVNAKQYNAILRRRQTRAKLEAEQKLIKGRKPYLHESRHLHAMKRVRGSGGRFANTKQQQQQHRSNSSNHSTVSDGNRLDSNMLQLSGGWNLAESHILQSQKDHLGASLSNSSADVANNGDMLQMLDPMRLADFHDRMNIIYTGSEQRPSVVS